jgi:hypothetical protein
MMADPNMTDFYRRAHRVQKDRARGYGFEAPGTLGRSYYTRPAAPRRSLLWPALFLLVVGFALKGAIFHATGSDLYNARVADLSASDGVVEQVGGWVMQADPVTLWVADKINMGLMKIKT